MPCTIFLPPNLEEKLGSAMAKKLIWRLVKIDTTLHLLLILTTFLLSYKLTKCTKKALVLAKVGMRLHLSVIFLLSHIKCQALERMSRKRLESDHIGQ
jgi:hypothetical protein